MDVQRAAAETLKMLVNERPVECARTADGQGLPHAHWMLHGIVLGYIEGDKAHRWLGYAQGLMVAEGLHLDAMKRVNKEA